MFLTTYFKRTFIAILTILGPLAVSAATVPGLPIPFHAAASTWTRTASFPFRGPLTSGKFANILAPEAILYAFKGIPDGQYPAGGLMEDAAGSLYGTTQLGGLVFPSGNTGGGGTVFKLTRTASGYSENLLYAFGASGTNDGYFPWIGSRLAMDRTGALYGATNEGGGAGSPACGAIGCGIVYKLKPTAKGYTETILHSFQGTSDGAGPATNPVLDRFGALYGTTVLGGSTGLITGVVYKLTPTGSGYKFSVIYTFGASGPNDGNQPYGALLVDERTGDLYGTTNYGGSSGNGIVFKLHPTASGYTYAILYSFDGSHGANPGASLIMDGAGALYGTAGTGGLSSSNCSFSSGGTCGVVFKLTPVTGGYNESVLYSFTGGTDGYDPASPLVADLSGNLYSTTAYGGSYGGGAVFKLVRTATGYREVTLHDFNQNGDGGQYSEPNGLLLEGGFLLGATYGAASGPDVDGSIFRLKIP